MKKKVGYLINVSYYHELEKVPNAFIMQLSSSETECKAICISK